MMYQISITAMNNGKANGVNLYKCVSPHMPPFDSVKSFLKKVFPLYAWEHEEGTDWDTDENTKFVEYIAHTSCRKNSSYIVATMYAV